MSQKPSVSLDNLDEFEQRKTVNTPLSMEACMSEGVDPKELLFRPRHTFTDPTIPKSVQDMQFEFYEKRRQETLALVKNSKQRLQTERESQEQSRIVSPHSPKYEVELERAKEKHLKFINKIMAHESVASEKMAELQKDKEKREAEEQRRREEAIQAERKRTEEKRKAELEAAFQERDKERLSKREAFNTFKQMLEARQTAEEREREKKRQEEEDRKAWDRQRQQKLEQVLSSSRKLLEDKEKRLREAQKKDKIRQRRLQEHRDQIRMKLEAQGKIAEEKRQAVLENLQQQMEERRKAYYDRKQEEQLKSERFMSEQRRSLESLRMQSTQRNSRISKTRETSEQILEKNREQILKKSAESDLKVQEQRQKLEDEMNNRRYRDMLKDLKKELNMKRYRMKQNYIATQAERRLQDQYRRVDEFSRMKSEMINRRLLLSTENEIKKFAMKESLYKMTVSKKWDFGLLQEIAEGRIVVTSSSSLGKKSAERPFSQGVVTN